MVNKKLTLLLDDKLIQKTKNYAAKTHQSLSQMVDSYFRYITSEEPKATVEPLISPAIEKLIGIAQIPPDLDIKKDYREARARAAKR